MHPLDNVIWTALKTRHTRFAERFRQARRFVREVSPLTAFLDPSPDGYSSLAGLVGANGTASLFLDEPYQPRNGWNVLGGAPLLQMICDNGDGSASSQETKLPITELGPADSADMLALTALTKPGPFGSRTHELGTYLGIRSDGKLIAMAGERLKVPGHTEISAVCTHPDHAGKGYARILMNELMHRVRRRRETPFLHVREDNTRAIALYEHLGFRTRRLLHYVVLQHG
jgi:ribosomal protein S18 acetylase RimI-like enzyme